MALWMALESPSGLFSSARRNSFRDAKTLSAAHVPSSLRVSNISCAVLEAENDPPAGSSTWRVAVDLLAPGGAFTAATGDDRHVVTECGQRTCLLADNDLDATDMGSGVGGDDEYARGLSLDHSGLVHAFLPCQFSCPATPARITIVPRRLPGLVPPEDPAEVPRAATAARIPVLVSGRLAGDVMHFAG